MPRASPTRRRLSTSFHAPPTPALKFGWHWQALRLASGSAPKSRPGSPVLMMLLMLMRRRRPQLDLNAAHRPRPNVHRLARLAHARLGRHHAMAPRPDAAHRKMTRCISDRLMTDMHMPIDRAARA